MEASRPTRPLLPPLLAISLTSFPCYLRAAEILYLNYTLAHTPTHTRASTHIYGNTYRKVPVRTTGETVGPECDATKTVDKEQEEEEEEDGWVVQSRWKRGEGERDRENRRVR